MRIRFFIKIAVVLIFSLEAGKVQAQRTDFFNINFSKADSVAELYPRHSLKDLKALAHKLTAPFSTEAEKFRTIFWWVTHNIDYDVDLYLKDKAKKLEYRHKPEKLTQWNKTFSKQLTGHMLTQYKTVCSGYSDLVDELCAHAGLTSKVIEGTGRSGISADTPTRPNHAWNSVKLDGKWYLCDATWSAGSVDLNARRYIRKYTDAYFLTPPQHFIRNHYPADSSWILLLKKPTRAEFFQQPVVYSAAIALQLNTITPNTSDVTLKANDKFIFTFISNHPGQFEKASILIKNKSTNDWAHPKLNHTTAGEYYLEHIFPKKGLYDVTVYLNRSACVGYEVRVK